MSCRMLGMLGPCAIHGHQDVSIPAEADSMPQLMGAYLSLLALNYFHLQAIVAHLVHFSPCICDLNVTIATFHGNAVGDSLVC